MKFSPPQIVFDGLAGSCGQNENGQLQGSILSNDLSWHLLWVLSVCPEHAFHWVHSSFCLQTKCFAQRTFVDKIWWKSMAVTAAHAAVNNVALCWPQIHVPLTDLPFTSGLAAMASPNCPWPLCHWQAKSNCVIVHLIFTGMETIKARKGQWCPMHGWPAVPSWVQLWDLWKDFWDFTELDAMLGLMGKQKQYCLWTPI